MITPLFIRGFVNVTIPAVYSDALTYEEQIGVLMAKINEVIEDFNSMTSGDIEAIIRDYLTPEKIQELISGAFGEYVDGEISENNQNYYTKTETDSEIGSAISEEVANRNAAIAVETARASGAELAINNNLSTNYYNKAQTDAAIAAHEPSLEGYATIQDAIDIDEASMEIEVTNRNNAISTAIGANNANYYTKTQVDQKDQSNRDYTDASIEAVSQAVETVISNTAWASYSASSSTWASEFNDVHSKYSDYNAGVTSDITNVQLDYFENHDSLGRNGEIALHGYLVPVSSSTINPGTSTAFMYVPFKVYQEVRFFAVIMDTSTGTTINVPMSLVPTDGNDSIMVYKNVTNNITPGFNASNKRIYFNINAVYSAAN
jgi:hypothetical protein